MERCGTVREMPAVERDCACWDSDDPLNELSPDEEIEDRGGCIDTDPQPDHSHPDACVSEDRVLENYCLLDPAQTCLSSEFDCPDYHLCVDGECLPCNDHDGDGWGVAPFNTGCPMIGHDCDDSDTAIHPGAPGRSRPAPPAAPRSRPEARHRAV